MLQFSKELFSKVDNLTVEIDTLKKNIKKN